MNFFTADLHFSHRNIIRFDDRPFLDLPSMHAELIKRWNSVVSPGDNVYVPWRYVLGPVRSSYDP